MKLWSSLAASAALVLAASSVAAPALAAPNDGAAQGASTSNKTNTDAGKSGSFKVPGAIGKQWKELRGTDADLGQPRAEQECGLRADACMQQFENGTLVWTPENGRVLTVRGALHKRWTDEKAQDGDFGYPLADEECTDSGCGQVFEGGQIHFTQGKETFTVRAPIIEAYGRSGDAAGPLGRPIAEVSCDLADGGCFQTFEQGSIYYTPKTQSWFVKGPIGEKWGNENWEHGDLGFPAGDTFCRLKDEGCFQTYQNGSIYWTKGHGAFKVGGPIGDHWGKENWEHGWLGFPTGDEGASEKGNWQTFQGGNLYKPKDKEVMAVRGDILARWGEVGHENGELGWPLTGEFCDLRDGGCANQFENGSIYWTEKTGAQIVRGAIRDVWASKGWEKSYLGYPTAAEDCSIGGEKDACFQTFQYGSVYWNRETGAFPVSGQVMKGWAAEGYETGRLGFPVSDLHFEMRDGNKVFFQEFEHGFVEYTQGNDPSVVMK